MGNVRALSGRQFGGRDWPEGGRAIGLAKGWVKSWPF